MKKKNYIKVPFFFINIFFNELNSKNHFFSILKSIALKLYHDRRTLKVLEYAKVHFDLYVFTLRIKNDIAQPRFRTFSPSFFSGFCLSVFFFPRFFPAFFHSEFFFLYFFFAFGCFGN